MAEKEFTILEGEEKEKEKKKKGEEILKKLLRTESGSSQSKIYKAEGNIKAALVNRNILFLQRAIE